MNLRRGRPDKLVITSIISGVIFIMIMLLVITNNIAWFDDAIISLVQGLENDRLTSFMKFLSFIGSSLMSVMIFVVVFLFLMIVLKHRRELIMFLVTVGGSELWNLILKNIIQRARPNTHRLVEITGFSFPSGHSMAAFALYGAITFLLWRHIPRYAGRIAMITAGIALTLLIGISRIYLGVHYPSDVIGGYAASATWLMICIVCFRKWSFVK
ncbi:phosphatase PAP2 family protein [Paenibacillus azoreducens]|uniref:Phosphatidylglycerophosphatase B n=1 Tax=Paenibacillus azoreducens TaxID=116718 RepID=A0A919YEF9_9BACL|nr:phosphatase PAP2 family protein [Paenibacillus azoreducens]GIO48158.1 phosphatidylglycerophosphatase B [Paenibacillus azoreducens]